MGNSDKNVMRLEILSRSENEGFARMVVTAFVSKLDPTIDEISDIKTAVSEAVTNAIIHGYEEQNDRTIVIICSIEGNELEVVISDSGNGIKDLEEAMQPLYTSRPDLERSGMGFTVMQTFMDEVNVKSTVGKGTEVRMKKMIKSSAVSER
jgi:stage II sporulation protein AB (anti-sigma F factor)